MAAIVYTINLGMTQVAHYTLSSLKKIQNKTEKLTVPCIIVNTVRLAECLTGLDKCFLQETNIIMYVSENIECQSE